MRIKVDMQKVLPVSTVSVLAVVIIVTNRGGANTPIRMAGGFKNSTLLRLGHLLT